MNQEDDTEKTPVKRKTRKVSVEEMVAVLREKDSAQQALVEAEKRYANAAERVDIMIKRAAAGTVKKALIELTQMKLA